jgi:hypothetical protein
VFELLQNADDNSLSRATASGSPPYISFSVFSRRIVVECNEDGFTEENLKAICAVGQSSKSGSEGYIGEKGIGFKSVFMAAWKVHILSGFFSFSFTHRPHQSGMGMITPVWEDGVDARETAAPLTRLTLHLHDTEASDALQNTERSIQQQFHDLQETPLLFMKNLKKIRIAFHDANEVETSSITHSIEHPGQNHAVLKRTVVENGSKRECVNHYHVTTCQLAGVPRHDNRSYADGAPSTSRVVLAFPLSEASDPIIQPQDVFAYLPVRPMGFKFIIQADFVTDASRQDIVRDSSRNLALLSGVAAAFTKAVLQFCEHEKLRLQWMRYLPDRNDVNWGPLWRLLVDKIANTLYYEARVLYCHKKFDRHRIRDLVRLGPKVCDNGEPLFEDGEPEDIISQRYSRSDLDILKEYGLKPATFSHLVKWLAVDLGRGAQSRMRSPTTTSSWHTQAARLMHTLFSTTLIITQDAMKAMALLPLEGGTWVSITTGPVYFARVAGIDIPPTIGLRLIDHAISNPHRLVLFRDLGVQEASVSLVRKGILGMYETPQSRARITQQSSKQHLTFLYLTQHLKTTDEPSYSDITLFDDEHYFSLNPTESVLYIATDKSPGSPWELLRWAHPEFRNHYFLDKRYFEDSPQTPEGQPLSWIQWFHKHLNIPKYVHFGDTCLSEAAQYLREHRPERFLGALYNHSRHNRHFSPEFIACVGETEVLCRGNKMHKLSGTYFPTKRLESILERFVKHDAFFPWISLGEERYETIPEDTRKFLQKIQAGIPKHDLGFGIDILLHTVASRPWGDTPESRNRLCSLYSFIQAQYRVEGGSAEAKDLIRLVSTLAL